VSDITDSFKSMNINSKTSTSSPHSASSTSTPSSYYSPSSSSYSSGSSSYSSGSSSSSYTPSRAPAGGISIGGSFYKGGQYIPKN